ncbi:hypothetical protein TorRG33x02_174940 [Trema orientale]|uniref:Transmembrane protein n=1 Tax=Trema orientale TaxID=63057 RepID=A0A2P5EME3_TREOI|nr:hypothetical protein TorRG33x02_174940 [Trema orientale]
MEKLSSLTLFLSSILSVSIFIKLATSADTISSTQPLSDGETVVSSGQKSKEVGSHRVLRKKEKQEEDSIHSNVKMPCIPMGLYFIGVWRTSSGVGRDTKSLSSDSSGVGRDTKSLSLDSSLSKAPK